LIQIFTPKTRVFFVYIIWFISLFKILKNSLAYLAFGVAAVAAATTNLKNNDNVLSERQLNIDISNIASANLDSNYHRGSPPHHTKKRSPKPKPY
jgi:hypothetical protein